MSADDKKPPDYRAEEVREAVAREAHALGITVTVSEEEALLEGCVESDGQRKSVEEIAQRILTELRVTNRIEIVEMKGAVKTESLS